MAALKDKDQERYDKLHAKFEEKGKLTAKEMAEYEEFNNKISAWGEENTTPEE